MHQDVFNSLKPAIRLLIALIVITGFFYPLTITALAQLFFPWKANGSMVERDGKIIGSTLIGQSFTASHYFWGRPSATPEIPYNGENSSGSNLGPTNPIFLQTVQKRADELKQLNFVSKDISIPVDLVTASGSGLDPEISPAAAFFQIARIAKARQISDDVIRSLILQHIKPRTLGVLGEPRVNVVMLNLALDKRWTRLSHPTN